MKLMRTLKWLIVRLIMQMKCRTSLMRNHEALSLGRSYPDNESETMLWHALAIYLATLLSQEEFVEAITYFLEFNTR